MERINDDILISIFTRFHNPDDRRSFSQVSKQFLKAACIGLLKLRISLPYILCDILPESPNLVSFECSKPLSNTHIELLAYSCSNLRHLKLRLDQNFDNSQPDSMAAESDFDDDGLSLAAIACRYLYEVSLRRRVRVGDMGVEVLIRSCKYLTILDLVGCVNVTDESLKTIEEALCCLENLSLQGCYKITDLGLAYLEDGNMRNFLKSLVLAECDRISDNGIVLLREMVRLTCVNLSICGVNVTDSGVWALTHIPNIEILNLSWLINVTDTSLFCITSACEKLQALYLTGCKGITGKGLRYFANRRTLEELELFSCDQFSWKDVERVLFTCTKLHRLGLSRKNKMLPEEFKDDPSIRSRNVAG